MSISLAREAETHLTAGKFGEKNWQVAECRGTRNKIWPENVFENLTENKSAIVLQFLSVAVMNKLQWLMSRNKRIHKMDEKYK